MPLLPHSTSAASVNPTAGGWCLQIPAGEAGSYRLAQLDDYTALPRSRFPLKTPATLSLRCRIAEPDLPGTWGFGFWNDPFAFSFGLQGTAQRLPVLPNAGWFFHASPENHLSFAPETRRRLAGSGFLAQTFRSPKIPPLLLAPGILGLPLLFSRSLSRLLRAAAGKIIHEDSVLLNVDASQWHKYRLAWRASGVTFSVEDEIVLETPVSPRGPLGLVIWMDNQFAAWTPEGRVGFGTLQQKTAGRLEIDQLEIR
jgi:hypothetical protein